MKKIYAFLFVIIGFYSFSFAYNEFSYENAKSLAKDYITNSSFDENWKDKNPIITGEGKYFYTDSENPSYVEFKVSCDNNPSCGFIMVNFDGDDVTIPIASTSGNTPSEVLSAKNGSGEKNNKLYYFSPFEQYAENEVTGDVSSIDPQDDYVGENSGTGKNSKELKKEDRNKFLKDKIIKSKGEAKKFKKSDDFKKLKKELKDKKQTNGKDEVSFKYLDFNTALADVETGNSTQYYTKPIYTSNIFVPGQGVSNTQCTGLLPCYRQFYETFQLPDCYSGCAPTALAMIYGYYDRNGKSNLVSGTAGIINDDYIKTMIRSIRTQMGTTCNTSTTFNGKYGGTTYPSNIQNAVQYAKDKLYSNSTSSYITGNTTTLFSNIQTEINSGRPVVGTTSNHAMAIFGYSNANYNSKVIRVNLGWGNHKFYDTNNNIYYGSNIDYNMDSIYYSGQTQGAILSITKFIIN